jgi:hypothetical protein
MDILSGMVLVRPSNELRELMMNRFLVLSCGAFLASTAAAQNIKVSGKITNPSGQAVSGALVELVKSGVKDTTGADGMYTLNQTPIAIRPGAAQEGMTMTGGMLQLQLDAAAPIEVRIHDVQGNLLRRNSVPDAAAGLYTWNVEEGSATSGMLIIHASVGAESRTFRYLPLGWRGTSGQAAIKSAARTGATLSKQAADVDTLKVTAAGYAVKKVALTSYEATVNVALETGSTDRWGGLKNPPAKSGGCGKAQGITSGRKTIQSGGQSREYIIDIPSNYNPNTPHRFFYVSHWVGGNAQEMAKNNYYAIKTEANAANTPAIFVAASGIGGFWGEADHPLFDNILAHVEENLCIDTTRVFAIGYSFGGMISYSLSRNHQHKIRAVVGIAPANYNIWLPNPRKPDPIPWLQIHGLQDETCRWVSNASRKEGGKFIVLEKAADNGCEIPAGDNFPVWQSGPHFCYEFKICTNNERHSGAEKYRDPGASSSWVPKTSWEFFMRF